MTIDKYNKVVEGFAVKKKKMNGGHVQISAEPWLRQQMSCDFVPSAF